MLFPRLSAMILAATLSGTCLLGCVQRSHNSTGRYYWYPREAPIPVFIDTRINQDARFAIEHSIDIWNSLIGWEVFEYSSVELPFTPTQGEPAVEPPYGNIYVYMTELGFISPTEVYLGITTRFSESALVLGIRSCTVRFDDDLSPDEWLFVSLHEFGHVLGLEHDDDINSIMFRFALASNGNVQDADVDEIRNMLEFD